MQMKVRESEKELDVQLKQWNKGHCVIGNHVKRLQGKTKKRRQREMLNQDSMAFENSKYTPDLVLSEVSQGPNGCLLNSDYMVIPDLRPTPYVPAPSRPEDVEIDKMAQSPRRRRHEHHVLFVERQTLVARQNQKFQSAIGRKFFTPTRNREMEINVDNEIDYQTTSEIDNNGNY
jgi:hypothetical protein